MIIKNEIDYIEECFSKVSEFVDEIIVIDTGSTDGTLEILEKKNCKVYNFEWCNDFSRARNFSVSKSTNDWILFLDADEHVLDFDIDTVRNFIKNNNGEVVGSISIRSFITTHTNIQIEIIPRIFNKKFYKFEGEIHETLVPKFNFIPMYKQLPVVVNHFGYLKDVLQKKNKTEIYKDYLKNSIKKKYDPYLVKHLAVCHLNSNEYNECLEIIETIINNKSLESTNYFHEIIITKMKALLALERYNEVFSLEKYYDICKKYDEYMFFMGLAFRYTNNGESALDIFEYLVNKPEISISRLLVVNEIAELLFDYGIYDEALNWYKKLEAIDSIKDKIKICEEKILEKEL